MMSVISYKYYENSVLFFTLSVETVMTDIFQTCLWCKLSCSVKFTIRFCRNDQGAYHRGFHPFRTNSLGNDLPKGEVSQPYCLLVVDAKSFLTWHSIHQGVNLEELILRFAILQHRKIHILKIYKWNVMWYHKYRFLNFKAVDK